MNERISYLIDSLNRSTNDGTIYSYEYREFHGEHLHVLYNETDDIEESIVFSSYERTKLEKFIEGKLKR